MSDTYDVIIIGAGPGGYVTAVRAAQLGLKTAVVEREHLGGICSNWGCIPTKALLRSAEVMHLAEHAKDYGLTLEGRISPDLQAVVERSRGVAGRMNNGVGFLMKKNKVDVIWGEARITKAGKDGAEILVSKPAKKPMQPQHPAPKNTKGEGAYKAKHLIVATGARIDPGLPEDPAGRVLHGLDVARGLVETGKKVVVIGGNKIGLTIVRCPASSPTAS